MSTSAALQPKHATIDGLAIRYAEGGIDGPPAILLAPWPESLYAFAPAWTYLAAKAHLIAVDPPGFGGSEYRGSLMNPKAMGKFILKVADFFELDHPHIVGPDIGTSSVLFAAAERPDAFRSIVVGSGGAAVPVTVAGVLQDWVEATDLTPYRQIGGARIVDAVLETIAGYAPSDQIREDYRRSYAGSRFSATIPYVQSYRDHLPQLAELLPGITTPVRIVAGADDPVVPRVNADFLAQRIPNSDVRLIPDTGHFCWEEKPQEYSELITSWWDRPGR